MLASHSQPQCGYLTGTTLKERMWQIRNLSYGRRRELCLGKERKTAATTTKRRCLGPRAERNPGSCANPFCLWGDFWENVAIESVFLSVYRIPGRRWHFVKKFSDPWPPHPQNLRTVIDKQAYKHGVNFLFFVTHWKGFSLWKRRYLADLCDCRSCSTSMKPCIRQRSAWKAIQLSYYVSLGHCSPELKNI